MVARDDQLASLACEFSRKVERPLFANRLLFQSVRRDLSKGLNGLLFFLHGPIEFPELRLVLL